MRDEPDADRETRLTFVGPGARVDEVRRLAKLAGEEGALPGVVVVVDDPPVFDGLAHVQSLPVGRPVLAIVEDEARAREHLRAGVQTTLLSRAIDASSLRRGLVDAEDRWIGHSRLVERDEEDVSTFALLESIAEGTGDLIAAEDLSYRYTYFNDAYRREFLRLWGQELQVGVCMVDLLAPWPEEQAKAMSLWRRALCGEAYRIQMEFGPSADRTRVYDLRFSPLRRGGEVIGAAHILRDTTDTVRTQVALRESEERLREASHRKDLYLAMLGHELRNPLSAICTATQLIKVVHADDSRSRRAVAALERQADQMTRLIDGLLEVSRIERGKIDFSPRVLNLSEVLGAVCDDHRAECVRRGVELESVASDQPLWVRGDRVRLVQIFGNLLGNAIKFTPEAGRIVVAARRDGANAEVIFSDTGDGIPTPYLEQIFEAFHQGERDLARAQGGLGLGLALAKQLVKLHGGTIDARSEGLGLGSTFTVRLPLTSDTQEQATPPASLDSVPRRVLLIEDNEDAAHTLRELLEHRGHRVEWVQTGADGLAAMRREPVDVVLCDIGLPGMTGYEVARSIRNDPALEDVYLVAITGYGQDADVRRTERCGFDEHLVKPVPLERLEQALGRLLRR